MWILFSFLSASLETVRDVLGKKISQKTDEYLTAFGIQLFSVLLLFPLVLIVGVPEIKPVFWLALLGAAITVPVGNILYMKAIKSTDISLVVPMLAFNPLFTALVAIFFEKTFPSIGGWMGILMVGMGLYALRLNKKVLEKGIFEPLLQIRRDSGALAMLGVALVWSFGANIGKIMVRNSSPLVSAFGVATTGMIILGLIVLARNSFKPQVLIKQIKQNFLSLGALGFAVGLSNLAMSAAFVNGFTPYVVSIKRTNIIFSSFAGKFFFKEKLTKNKILGMLMMFLGLVMIILG